MYVHCFDFGDDFMRLMHMSRHQIMYVKGAHCIMHQLSISKAVKKAIFFTY